MAKNQLVDKKLIYDMLYGEESYVKEFAVASLESFEEFKDHFHKYLINRDLDELRRAGHKIKPAAQMLNLHPVIDMYETSKVQIQENHDQKELEQLAGEMDEYLNQVLDELSKLTD